MGGAIAKGNLLKHCVPGSKFESEIVEAMQRREVEGSSMRSFNGIILKFPKIEQSLRTCKTTFDQFDEDSNGVLDTEELKNCFKKLEINFTDDEINDLSKACDINKNRGIEFNEYIVLMCIVYLLQEQGKPTVGLPQLEATFETLVDAFVFLDKNRDGYVSKKEMMEAMNETSETEQSSECLATIRFEEMDWDKDGTVSFKEFLFALTRWIGIDELEYEQD